MGPSVSTESMERSTRQQFTLTDVLNALSEYRAAEASMLRRARSVMDHGATDALALRYLRDARAAGEELRPTELAARLGLSSATVTALVDRLVACGVVRRERHPVDRRAVILRVTDQGADTYVDAFDEARRPLADVIASLNEDELTTVMAFISRMRDAMDEIGKGR